MTAALLRRLPVGRIEAAVNALAHAAGGGPRWRAEAKVPAHLRDSAVRGYPDEFYEVVARAYRSLSALSARPVGELAEANDVPVTTAQRWVKEARARACSRRGGGARPADQPPRSRLRNPPERSWPWQRSAGFTLPSTCSMCMPHPA
ncbi:MAG: hypothetical protein R2711_13255 [Acidimicrobiales bacterium]